MIPQVTIISRKSERILKKLIKELRLNRFTNFEVVESIEQVSELILDNYRGFFIFCLPATDLIRWENYIENHLGNYYLLYYYHSLYEERIDTSVFLIFDFVITGEGADCSIAGQLNFLQSNFWKKVPLSKLKVKKKHLPKTIRKLFYHLESTTDIDSISLSSVIKKLKINEVHFKRDLKESMNLNFTQLKDQLSKYYQSKFPEKFPEL